MLGMDCSAVHMEAELHVSPPDGFDEGPWLVLHPFHCILGQHVQTNAASMVKEDSAQETKQRSTPACTSRFPKQVSLASHAIRAQAGFH